MVHGIWGSGLKPLRDLSIADQYHWNKKALWLDLSLRHLHTRLGHDSKSRLGLQKSIFPMLPGFTGSGHFEKNSIGKSVIRANLRMSFLSKEDKPNSTLARVCFVIPNIPVISFGKMPRATLASVIREG